MSSLKPASEMKSRLKRDPWIMVATILSFVLVLVIVLPQLWIAVSSLTDAEDGGFTFGNFIKFFTTKRFQQSVINSILLSITITLGSCIIAVPLAYFYARYDIPGKASVLTLVTMATISPPFLGAYAWVMLLGKSGILMKFFRNIGLPLPFDSIMGFGGIVWVGIWINYALVFLLVHDAFANLDPSLEEASMSVGANKWRTFIKISAPLILPAILTGAYMVSMAALADFGTPIIIGRGVPTLAVTVYYEFLSEVQTNPSLASAASIVMISISTLALMAQRYFISRRSFTVLAVRRDNQRPLKGVKLRLVQLYTVIVLVISFTPHVMVLITSFMKWSHGILKWQFSLENYINIFERSLSPIFISYFLSFVSTLFDIAIGVTIAYIIVRKGYKFITPLLNTLVMVPYIVPGTVLAIGLILTFNKQPIILTGTWMILCLSYFIRRLPYSMKTAESALYQIHPSLEEAAMSVGATASQAFKDITAKLIIPSIVTGGSLTFLMTITELSSTIMLYAAPWITMTVVIFQAALVPDASFGPAAAMTVILMLSVYVPLYLLRRKFKIQSTM